MILQNIKRRWKLILLLLVVACAACVAAACSNRISPKNEGYTATVVYDANGGSFEVTAEKPVRTFLYVPGTIIKEPTPDDNDLKQPTRTFFRFDAWYPAVLGEDGEPLKNAEGEFVDESGISIFDSQQPYDFTQKLPDEADYTLYLVANWKGTYTFTIDVGEEARAAGAKDYVFYADYPQAVVPPAVVNIPKWSGHSIRYFVTEDGEHIYGTESLRELYLDDENSNITVTIEWLEGDWVVLSDPEQLADLNSYSDYWLDKDIDMTGFNDIKLNNFNGEFAGNGHKISNLTVTDATSYSSVPTEFGLFSFTARGFMHDVTFENVTYNVEIINGNIDVGMEFNVGLFAGDGSALDLTKFTDISFIGCTLNITRRAALVQTTEVNYGIDTDYEGIFGILGADQVFTPAADSQPITVQLLTR